MSKQQEMWRIIRMFRETTGKTEVTMAEVAQFAVRNGMPLPPPIDPIERLAGEFSRAAREQIKHDETTGRPYRVNHAYTTRQGDHQVTLWIDIDNAPRLSMHKSAIQRREQMVGDAVQLSFDLDHWNAVNPDQEPITVPLDFTDDVEWRKNAPDEEAS